MKYTSRVKLLEELGWETIATRIDYLSICHFHKMVIGQTRERIRECLPPRNQGLVDLRKTRAFGDYPYPARIRSKYIDKSFFPRTVKLWDNLTYTADMQKFK